MAGLQPVGPHRPTWQWGVTVGLKAGWGAASLGLDSSPWHRGGRELGGVRLEAGGTSERSSKGTGRSAARRQSPVSPTQVVCLASFIKHLLCGWPRPRAHVSPPSSPCLLCPFQGGTFTARHFTDRAVVGAEGLQVGHALASSSSWSPGPKTENLRLGQCQPWRLASPGPRPAP